MLGTHISHYRIIAPLGAGGTGIVYLAEIDEVGDTDGRPFIAMAYCEGETLTEPIARGPLPLNELLALAEQIASGLASPHAAKVVHRNLEPKNIVVTGVQ